RDILESFSVRKPRFKVRERLGETAAFDVHVRTQCVGFVPGPDLQRAVDILPSGHELAKQNIHLCPCEQVFGTFRVRGYRLGVSRYRLCIPAFVEMICALSEKGRCGGRCSSFGQEAEKRVLE